jgi:hypothetical protein
VRLWVWTRWLFFFLFTGAATLCRCWPPPWLFSIGLCRFRNSNFFQSGFVSPTSNPQPRGTGTALRLAPTLWRVWHGWPYQKLTLPPAYLYNSIKSVGRWIYQQQSLYRHPTSLSWQKSIYKSFIKPIFITFSILHVKIGFWVCELERPALRNNS